MPLDEALQNVAVVGAAGKMGSGISLLLLQEMAHIEAEQKGKAGTGAFRLILIDTSEKGLDALRHYLHEQILKYAEKNINDLRRFYVRNPKLVSNQEIIEAFVEGALDLIHCETSLEKAKHATLIFEAIIEDVEAKVQLFKSLVAGRKDEAYFFTNTSSIPISILNEKAQLHNRLIGFHFYNPPAVQKLLEVIAPDHMEPALKSLALELAKRLRKTVVHSGDVAGFIGNGHFIREALFACHKVHELTSQYTLEELLSCESRDARLASAAYGHLSIDRLCRNRCLPKHLRDYEHLLERPLFA